MIVFCPKCGSKNKSKGDFCHNCGQNLPKLNNQEGLKNNEKKIGFLSTSNFILTSLDSLFCSFFAIYILLNNLVEWRFISTAFLILGVVFIISAMLSIYSKFYLKQSEIQNGDKDFKKLLSDDSTELLQEADFSNNVPASIVENTTRKLNKEILNNKEI